MNAKKATENGHVNGESGQEKNAADRRFERLMAIARNEYMTADERTAGILDALTDFSGMEKNQKYVPSTKEMYSLWYALHEGMSDSKVYVGVIAGLATQIRELKEGRAADHENGDEAENVTDIRGGVKSRVAATIDD